MKLGGQLEETWKTFESLIEKSMKNLGGQWKTMRDI